MSFKHVVQHNRFTDMFREDPKHFGVLWFGCFIFLISSAFLFGVVPEALLGGTDDVVEDVIVVSETVIPEAGEVLEGTDEPVRIVIDSIGVDTSINNPASRDINVLDSALQSGAVHYPGSGNLEDTSNLFLFGHSTSLPTVINPAYQAFNGVKDLEAGDVIRVQSKTHEYIYKVTSLELVNADEAWVDLSQTEKKLTLSTCNTFGKKQDRYVVEATFFGSYPLEV